MLRMLSIIRVHKTCDTNVKCLECVNERHIIAMHTTSTYKPMNYGSIPKFINLMMETYRHLEHDDLIVKVHSERLQDLTLETRDPLY